MRKYIFFIALLLTPVLVYSQAEHVPANHPVYDFLNRMHILGNIEGFSRAVLPMERKQVVEFIRKLHKQNLDLSETERLLLERYRDEFVAEADGTQDPAVLFSGKKPFVETMQDSFSDREKFLYTWANEDRSTTLFMEFIGTAEYRTLFQKEQTMNVWLGQIGGRFRGTIGGFVGYGLQSTNGTSRGNREFALTDRVLRQNSNFGDWRNEFFDITEGYVSANWNWGNISLGKEQLLYGNGIGNRVLISANPPPFDALRLNIHTGSFRFSFVHGSLLAIKDTAPDFKPYYDSKYLVIHRAEVDILDIIRIGVYEAVIYSQREIDLQYLNPVNFYKSAEHASGDRDNPMLGFDFQTLKLGGNELYGSWTIDDVTFSKWGTGWWGNKFAWQAGAINQTLIPNTELGVEYSRVEPYTFGHIFRNTEYTNKEDCLGFEIPSNSDEWLLRARHWIGPDLLLALSYQFRRHGLNVYGPDSIILQNNGGDINEKFVNGRDDINAPFLNGPLEKRHIVTASVRYEPVRNLVFDATYRFRSLWSEATNKRNADHFISLLLEIYY